MKSPRFVVPMLVALTLVAMLSGCSKKSTPTGLDALDQAPPAAPTQITANWDDATATGALAWTPSASANVAGYQIYQYSPRPDRESAFVLVGETDAATTSYALPTSNVTTTVYYRICAVTSTGVKSAWSSLIPVTLGPPQGGENDPGGVRVPVTRP